MKRLLAGLLLTVSISACSSMPSMPNMPNIPLPFTDRTQNLEVGMTQREVEKILGDYKILSSRYSTDRQPMTVWSYQKSEEDPVHWIFIKGGKLVQWGTPALIQQLPEVRSMNLPLVGETPAANTVVR